MRRLEWVIALSRNRPVSQAPSTPRITWQERLLPFMLASLVFVGVFFSVTTYLFFDRLQGELQYNRTEIGATLARADQPASGPADAAYRDWYVRATLEQMGLQQRFNVQIAIVKGRLWARFMGFLTGMLLALTGCVFVLGQLRAKVAFSGEAQGAKTALDTNAPGLLLALLGTIIIGLALAVPGSVESSDTAIYLPPRVELPTAPGTTAAPLAAPPPPLPSPQSAASGVPRFPSPFGPTR